MSSIQILTFHGNRCEVNTEGFFSLLDKVGDHKFIVVSINGSSRLGKSTALNCILHFLQGGGGGAATSPGAAPPPTLPPNWPMTPPLSPPISEEFRSARGPDSVTKGVHIWSEPFFINLDPQDTGCVEPVAVLLMDTQGLFDMGATMLEEAILYSFSSLCSSIMIYNCSQLNESTLQHIEHFAQFAAATAISSPPQAENRRMATQGNCQKFLFLYRDFPWPYDYPYGFHNENYPPQAVNYMKRFLIPPPGAADGAGVSEDGRQLRQVILNSFSQLSLFLMPHPGQAYLESQTINFGVATPDFQTHMTQFVSGLMSPAFLNPPKSVRGVTMTGLEFKSVVVHWGAAYGNLNEAPQVQRLAVLNEEAVNRIVLQRSLTLYYNQMSIVDFFRGYPSGVEDGVLQARHEAAKIVAVGAFETNLTFGSEARRRQMVQQLCHQLDAYFREAVRPLNVTRRTAPAGTTPTVWDQIQGPLVEFVARQVLNYVGGTTFGPTVAVTTAAAAGSGIAANVGDVVGSAGSSVSVADAIRHGIDEIAFLR